MKGNKYIYFFCFCVVSILTSCSAHKASELDNQSLSLGFEDQMGTAPVGKPFFIAEETPFGVAKTYNVTGTYTSALGEVCRNILVVDNNQNVVVCFHKNKGWYLVPSLD